MAKQSTFTVSKKGFKEFEVGVSLPETLDDPRWNEIVSDKGDVHDLAMRAWIVQCQANARNRLEEGVSDEQNQATVQSAVSSYVYGARSGGFQRPTLAADKAKELKFTKEQLAQLAALGVKIEAAA